MAARRRSLIRQFADFTNTTAGLDLTLRLIHALAIVGAETLNGDAAVKGCATATLQLALGESMSCRIETTHCISLSLYICTEL